MSAFAQGPASASTTTSLSLQPLADFELSLQTSPALAGSAFAAPRRPPTLSPAENSSGGHAASASPHDAMERFGGLDFASGGMVDDGIMASIPGNDGGGSAGDGAKSKADSGGESSKKDDKPDPPPPWSEMKTKAGKERKRLPLACIACRRKKIRCSGEKPACKHCLRSRIPCVYKVTTRKAAPRTDYMAMLDKRLKRMEERVIRIIPKDSVGAVVGNTRAIVKPAIPPPPTKTPTQKKRSADDAFGDRPDDWPKSGGKREGESAGVVPRPQQCDASEEGSLLTEGAESLPAVDIQEHLAEVFFDYVYGQAYFLLHKPSFIRRLKAGKVPPVLILSVCAISARFSNHPSLRTEPAFLRGDEWAAPARDIALKRFDKPNLTILTCYMLLGLHAFGTCQGGASWMFGGMGQRMAYALQLHKELDYENWGRDQEDRPAQPRLSHTDQEIRRRTMWSCFMMDRLTSSGTDRPFFLWEKHIQIQLPIKEASFQRELDGRTEHISGGFLDSASADDEKKEEVKRNTGLAAYIVRAVAVWGSVIRYINLGGKEEDKHPIWSSESGYSKLVIRAEGFRRSIPSWYEYTPENLQVHSTEKIANQFIFLHLFIHMNLLFLNRFALPSPASNGARPSKDMPQEFLANAQRTTIEAANQVSTLLEDAMEYRLVAPFAGYCAFISSTVHIPGIFAKNPKLEGLAKKNLSINVKYLTKIKGYWGMFHFVAEQLKDQYRQQADLAAPGGAATKGKDGAGIFQYGDWFDRYPNGVSSTDFEDPAHEVKKEPGTDGVMAQGSAVQSVEDFFATLSPTSKQEHQQKMAKKKRQSAATAPRKPSPPNSGKRTQAAQTQSLTSHPKLSVQPEVVLDPLYHTPELLSSQSPFVGTGQADWDAPTSQGSASWYPGTGRMLSELDRQMVLSSYSGYDTIPSGLTPPEQNADKIGAAMPEPSRRHNNATEAFLLAQRRAQAQVQAQAQARLQQQQQLHAQQAAAQQQQQRQQSTPVSGSQEWASWDIIDPTSPSSAFDPAAPPGGFHGGNAFGFGPDVNNTAWFMPFNLHPPEIGMSGGGGAGGGGGGHGGGGMWDYVFTGSGTAAGALGGDDELGLGLTGLGDGDDGDGNKYRI